MEISDVSELSEPLVAPMSFINPSINTISCKKQDASTQLETFNDIHTEDYYDDTFESISSDISFRKHIIPPLAKPSIKRAKPLAGEALRRDLMGLDGQGKLAPESLGQR